MVQTVRIRLPEVVVATSHEKQVLFQRVYACVHQGRDRHAGRLSSEVPCTICVRQTVVLGCRLMQNGPLAIALAALGTVWVMHDR